MSTPNGMHFSAIGLFIFYVIFSVLYWITSHLIYMCIRCKRHEKPVALRLANHIVSTLHALVCIFVWLEMTLVSCPLPGKTFFTSFTCFNTTSAGMELGMMITTTYLIQDMISVRISFGKGKGTNEVFFHHIIGLIGLISGLCIGKAVGVIVICLLITEISTIFLNNRNILKELNLIDRKKCFNYYNGILLLSTFFLFRVVFLGVFLGAYIIPVIITYPYVKVAKEIGWVKIRWA